MVHLAKNELRERLFVIRGIHLLDNNNHTLTVFNRSKE